MTLDRRALLGALLMLPALPRPGRAQAPFPTRAVTVVVPYAPGGGSDVITRAAAPLMEAALGQPVVVDNRAGGGTSVGSTYVAQARPDGYILLMGATPLAINPALQPNLTPRDPLRELAPIGPLYRNPFVLQVHASVPARSLAEFIALAKARPGVLNYGSAGIGTVNHLAFEMLKRAAGIDVEHVPYRGGAPALLDLRANRIQASFNSALEALPLIREGATRPLAVSAPERLPLLPDVPTVAETVPGFDVAFWQGLFAPAGTPAPVIERLAAALRAATSNPALRARMAEQGVTLQTGGPEDMRRQLERETEAWGTLIRSAGLRPQ